MTIGNERILLNMHESPTGKSYFSVHGLNNMFTRQEDRAELSEGKKETWWVF